MKSKLLNKNAYEAVCRNCKHGRLSPEGDAVLCVKKGIVDPDWSCRRYSYDPLKRVPRKMPAVREANPEDFDLNAGVDIPKKIIGIPPESVEEEVTAETVEDVSAEAEKEEILVAEETPEPVAEEDMSEEAAIPEEHPDNGVVLDEGEEDEEILFDDDDETLFDDDEDYLDEDDDLGEDFFDDDEDDEYDGEYDDEYDDGESIFDDDDDIIFDNDDDDDMIFDNDDDDGFDEDEELFLDEIFEEEEDDPSKDWSKTSIFDVGDETETK